jgi:hypothetical protein
MNKQTVSYVLALCIILFAFSSHVSPAARMVPQRSGGRASIAQEAERIAREHWRARMTQCGESYFTFYRQGHGQILTLREMRHVTIETIGEPPPPPRTEAEILNERENPTRLQWRGKSLAWYTLYREMTESTRKWGRWIDTRSNLWATLEKVGGNWKVFPEDVIRFTCKDVDTFTLKLGAVAETPPSISEDGVLTLPARFSGWFSIGRGPLLLLMGGPYPQIYIERGGRQSETPNDNNRNIHWQHDSRAKAPSIKLGALLAKIGANGSPFAPFREGMELEGYYRNGEYVGSFIQSKFETTEEIFLAINDYDYSDNRGAFKFTVVGRSNNSTGHETGKANSRTLPVGIPYEDLGKAPILNPSSRWAAYSGQFYELKVPENWQEIQLSTSGISDGVVFAPHNSFSIEKLEAANVSVAFTHGIKLMIYTDRWSGNLEAGTKAYVNHLTSTLGYLQQQGAFERNRALGGRDTMVARLSGKTPLTAGYIENVTVYTSMGRGGQFYVLTAVVPQGVAVKYQRVFDGILSSISLLH